MIPDPNIQPTMTVPEAGEVIGLCKSAAYAAAKRGEIPTVRIGRRMLVPTAQLRRLLHMDPEPAEYGRVVARIPLDLSAVDQLRKEAEGP